MRNGKREEKMEDVHVSTENNRADIGTKALKKDVSEYLMRKMGLDAPIEMA